MKDFIEIQDNSLDEIVYNAMILFRNNDLGAKIDTSLNREIKKDTEVPEADAPLQLRLRFHNRFNMDLNNIYALELIPQDDGLLVETSVNVYHDNFNEEEFTGLVHDIFKDVLTKKNVEFINQRFTYNFRNTSLHLKAAKEKQFIIDPEVDRLKEMHDVHAEFKDMVEAQVKSVLKKKANDLLKIDSDIILAKRKITHAKSKILKISHLCSDKQKAKFMASPQFFSILLLEYCLVPLFLANELYVMSLIYNRDLEDIRTVLKRRIEEV